MKTILASLLITLAVAHSLSVANLMASSTTGQKVILGKSVPTAQQVSMDQFDHSAWSRLLQKYVNDSGQVNYQSWSSSAADGQALDDYLNLLSTAGTKLPASRNSKLAFWINAYNAVTIKGILREYPTSSIRNHTAKLFGYNIWKDLLLIVGDTKTSLDSMEHSILRKSSEPRIHFAIVCASHSCPRLLNTAYLPNQLDEQLTANTIQFFGNSENFQYNSQNEQFKVSSILSWFEEDFGKNKAERLKTIAPYLPTKESKSAANLNAVSIAYLTYDWSLNEQRLVRQAKRQ